MRTMIKGASLVYGSGVRVGDVLIQDGKFIAIKEEIKPIGVDHIVDGTSYYVLPGFIASMDTSAGYEHGVTTLIRHASEGVESIASQETEGMYDYVYSVGLKELNKKIVETLYSQQVKVVKLQSSFAKEIHWELWQPRLKRHGIVLEIETEQDYDTVKEQDLPVVLPLGSRKRKVTPRTIYKIGKEALSMWQKLSTKLDPFVFSGYWIDVRDYPVQGLKNNEAETFLMKLVKTRSSIPAKLLGIYPRKGSISIGADADFMLVSKIDLVNRKDSLFKPEKTWIKGIGCHDDGSKIMGQRLPCQLTYGYSY